MAAAKSKPKAKGASATAKTETKVKPKAKAAPKTKKSAGLITTTATTVEHLTEAKTHALVHDLIVQQGSSEFMLGGALARVKAEEWYGDHEAFDAYVENEHGFGYRKAAYLVATYEHCVEAGVTDKEAESLGMSKLREIAPILTPKNKAKWIKVAENLTVRELVEKLRKSGPKKKGGTASSDTTRLVFVLHDDAAKSVELAIERAKQDADTEYDSEALNVICSAFLATPKKGAKPTKASLKASLNGAKLADVLAAIGKEFPDVVLNVEEPEDDEEEEDEEGDEEEDEDEEEEEDEDEDEEDEDDDEDDEDDDDDDDEEDDDDDDEEDDDED